MSVVDSPVQRFVLPLMVMTGGWETSTVTEAVLKQPSAEVPMTLYWPKAFTGMAAFVLPLLHI